MGPTSELCPTCRALPGLSCLTKTGKHTAPHEARKRLAREASYVADVAKIVSKPSVDTWQPRAGGPGPNAHLTAGNTDADLDDAKRYVRNLAFGITDDTLDPTVIIPDLLSHIDDIVHRATEDMQAAQNAAEDAQAEAELERDKAEKTAEDMRERANHWEAEAIKARDQRDALALQLKAAEVALARVGAILEAA